LAVAATALMLGGAADRIEFPPETPAKTPASKKQTSPQPPPSIATPVLGQAQAATPAEPPAQSQGESKTNARSPSRTRDDARATAQTQIAAVAPPKADASPKAGLDIAQWGFTNTLPGGRYPAAASTAVHGGPVYFWIKVKGGQAAVERLRSDGRLAIEVRWIHDGGNASAGTRDHITELPIGRRELASSFAEQVKRYGFFEWHSWARKDVLGRGRWTVSLTYADGQPVLCGEAQPCRFPLTVGEAAG
jgi:hypothetical protein